MQLDLPHAGDIAFDVLDAQGRVVASFPSRGYPAGRWTLQWDGRDAGGAGAPPGLYLARVRVGGVAMIRRIALIR